MSAAGQGRGLTTFLTCFVLLFTRQKVFVHRGVLWGCGYEDFSCVYEDFSLDVVFIYGFRPPDWWVVTFVTRYFVYHGA